VVGERERERERTPTTPFNGTSPWSEDLPLGPPLKFPLLPDNANLGNKPLTHGLLGDIPEPT
jgi:hypothetical protein